MTKISILGNTKKDQGVEKVFPASLREMSWSNNYQLNAHSSTTEILIYFAMMEGYIHSQNLFLIHITCLERDMNFNNLIEQVSILSIS